MDIKEKVKYWIDSAESDLDASIALFNNDNYLQIAFFCHRSVEKYFKAYHWYKFQTEPAYTHNLIKLSKDNSLFELLSNEQKDFVAALIPLNLKGRYPDDQDTILSNLTPDDFEDILNNTKELLKWIRKHLTE